MNVTLIDSLLKSDSISETDRISLLQEKINQLTKPTINLSDTPVVPPENPPEDNGNMRPKSAHEMNAFDKIRSGLEARKK